MTNEAYQRFLAACAAGGAIAPTVALVAFRACGRRPAAEIDDDTTARIAALANELAEAVNDTPVALTGFDLESCPSGQAYTSCRGTSLVACDTEVVIHDMDGHDVPQSHYRQRAATFERCY